MHERQQAEIDFSCRPFSRRLLLLDDQCAPQSFLALQVVDESLAFEALGIPLDSFLFFLDGSQVA